MILEKILNTTASINTKVTIHTKKYSNYRVNNNLNLFEYIVNLTRLYNNDDDFNNDNNYIVNNQVITNRLIKANETFTLLPNSFDEFLSKFPTSIIQLIILILVITFIILICKCSRYLDNLREQLAIKRQNALVNPLSSHSSSVSSGHMHYTDEMKYKQSNYCFYWLLKRYYCLRRIRRRIFGFRKQRNYYRDKRGFKRRFNVNCKNFKKNRRGDSLLFRRHSIIDRRHVYSNRYQQNRLEGRRTDRSVYIRSIKPNKSSANNPYFL